MSNFQVWIKPINGGSEFPVEVIAKTPDNIEELRGIAEIAVGGATKAIGCQHIATAIYSLGENAPVLLWEP